MDFEKELIKNNIKFVISSGRPGCQEWIFLAKIGNKLIASTDKNREKAAKKLFKKILIYTIKKLGIQDKKR